MTPAPTATEPLLQARGLCFARNEAPALGPVDRGRLARGSVCLGPLHGHKAEPDASETLAFPAAPSMMATRRQACRWSRPNPGTPRPGARHEPATAAVARRANNRLILVSGRVRP